MSDKITTDVGLSPQEIVEMEQGCIERLALGCSIVAALIVVAVVLRLFGS